MRVGLMADSHDRLPAVAELTRRLTEGGVGLILHAGDYCSPFSLMPYFEANVALLGVFGRNDGDHAARELLDVGGLLGVVRDGEPAADVEVAELVRAGGSQLGEELEQALDA